MKKNVVRYLMTGKATVDVSDFDSRRLNTVLTHFNGLLITIDTTTRMYAIIKYENDEMGGVWRLRSLRLNYKTLPEFSILSGMYSGEGESHIKEPLSIGYIPKQKALDMILDDLMIDSLYTAIQG